MRQMIVQQTGLDFIEAYMKLIEGARIRREGWSPGSHVVMEGDGFVRAWTGGGVYCSAFEDLRFKADDVIANDWAALEIGEVEFDVDDDFEGDEPVPHFVPLATLQNVAQSLRDGEQKAQASPFTAYAESEARALGLLVPPGECVTPEVKPIPAPPEVVAEGCTFAGALMLLAENPGLRAVWSADAVSSKGEGYGVSYERYKGGELVLYPERSSETLPADVADHRWLVYRP